LKSIKTSSFLFHLFFDIKDPQKSQKKSTMKVAAVTGAIAGITAVGLTRGLRKKN
jgi:hypothetical protein